MNEWKFSPKRVLVLCFGALVLGIEPALLTIGYSGGESASSLFLKGGLTSIAVALASCTIFLSARKTSDESSATDVAVDSKD